MDMFDELLSPAFWADPGRHCQPWLAGAPPVMPCALGGFAILGHAALSEAARASAAGGCPVPPGTWPGLEHWPALLSEGLFTLQGADHAAARARMIAAFGAAPIDPLVASSAAIVADLPPRCDLTDDLARPVMVRLWSDLTGVPEGELRDMAAPLGAFASFLPDAARADAAEAAAGRLFAALQDAPEGAPLLAGLDAPGRRLVAGMTIDALETAPAGLAGAIAVLLTAGWRGEITSTIAEEAFRRAAPAPATVRQATARLSLAGVEVPAGTLLWMVWAAGDHDPRRHADPLTFRPDRPAPHRALAFGAGGHACLGRGLVRRMLAAVWLRLGARNARLVGRPTFATGTARAPVGARLALD